MAKDDKKHALARSTCTATREHGWHNHVMPGKFPYIIGGFASLACVRRTRAVTIRRDDPTSRKAARQLQLEAWQNIARGKHAVSGELRPVIDGSICPSLFYSPRVNVPHKLNAGGKVIVQLARHFLIRIAGREDFDGQIRRYNGVYLLLWELPIEKAFPANERDVGHADLCAESGSPSGASTIPRS